MEEAASLDGSRGLLNGASTAVGVAAGTDRVPGANGTITATAAVPNGVSVARFETVVVVAVHVGVSFVADRDGV